jgi:hypothetical protein
MHFVPDISWCFTTRLAQRATLLHLRQDLDLKRVAVSVDVNGVGWFRQFAAAGPQGAPSQL